MEDICAPNAKAIRDTYPSCAVVQSKCNIWACSDADGHVESSSLSAKYAAEVLGSRNCGTGNSAKSAARESVGMTEAKLKGRKSFSF